ncbi:MAG: thioredoxin domain-containing protein, partial [Anaerolineales bacterium]
MFWGFLLAACVGQEASVPPQSATVISLPSGHPPAPPAECVALNVEPTPDATLSVYFPPPAAADWRIGVQDAAVTFIMYGDFQCPYCAQLYPVLLRLQQDFPNDVRVVFRHIPLASHDKAVLAAQAAEAAGKQGRFFEMAEKLFAEQTQWAELAPEQFSGWLDNTAAAIGLDAAQFQRDLNSPEVTRRVSEAKQAVEYLIPGTPFLLINGEPYINRPRNYESLATIVEFIRFQKRQFTEC